MSRGAENRGMLEGDRRLFRDRLCPPALCVHLGARRQTWRKSNWKESQPSEPARAGSPRSSSVAKKYRWPIRDGTGEMQGRRGAGRTTSSCTRDDRLRGAVSAIEMTLFNISFCTITNDRREVQRDCNHLFCPTEFMVRLLSLDSAKQFKEYVYPLCCAIIGIRYFLIGRTNALHTNLIPNAHFQLLIPILRNLHKIVESH